MTTSLFSDRFGGKKCLFPVIHVEDEIQALRNARIARDNGADGVFLINHDTEKANHEFMRYTIFPNVKRALPGFFVGINCLDLMTAEAIRRCPIDADAIWVDNAGLREHGNDRTAFLEYLKELKGQHCPNTILFGGVAFKYQEEVSNPGVSAALAAPYIDIITTSGEATGIEPEADKIRGMRNSIGNHPLAIASGITPDNVSFFLRNTNAFLVATGISRSFTELDPDLVAKTAKMVHG